MLALSTVLIAFAATPTMEGRLDRLVEAGAKYPSLRAELLADRVLMKRLTEARLERWEHRVFAEILIAHRDHPDLAQRVARPSGLIPKVYLAARTRRPVPYRSLSRLPEEAGPFLLELFFKARYLGAFSERSDFPPAVPEEKRKVLRAEEARALPIAVLHALGQMQHPHAATLLCKILTEGPPALQPTAAMALGKTGSDRALSRLSSLATSEDPDLRAAALIGLGAIASKAAFDLLLGALPQEGSRQAALRSLQQALAKQPGILAKERRDRLIAALDHLAPTTTPDEQTAMVELLTVAQIQPSEVRVKTPAFSKLLERVAKRRAWSQRRIAPARTR